MHGKKEHGLKYEFVCSTCGDDFAKKILLMRHQRCHTEEKNLKCGLCNFRALRPFTMQMHWKREDHKNVTVDMNCRHCNYKAVELVLLESHIQDNHQDDKKLIQCDNCEFNTFQQNVTKLRFKS